MTIPRDELEDRLRSLFHEQAEATTATPADWTEVRPVARRLQRPVRRLVLAAAAVAGVVAVVAATGGDATRVRTGPADDAGTASSTTTVPAPAPAAFSAETPQVVLRAGAVEIQAGGRTFSTVAPVRVHGDPGTPEEYTSLELTWTEHGVEMRLFVYFTSDGRDWWSDEIRTFDGRSPGEWVTYRGEFFRRPLGTAFTGDFEVSEPAPGTGRLRLAGTRLEAFRRLPACDTAGAGLVLDAGIAAVEMPGPQGRYGVNVALLDAASCDTVADQDRYRYTWVSRDPAVVRVEAGLPSPELGTRHGELVPEGSGTTSVRVTATDPATGAPVAETDIPVTVLDVAPPTVGTVLPPSPPPVAPISTLPPASPPPVAGDPGPALRSATADLAAGTITVTFDRPVTLGPAPLAALYLVVHGDDPTCASPDGNSHEVLSGNGTATLTLDATSLARPTTYIVLAPGFVTGTDTGAPSPPLGCTPVPTT